MKVLGKVILVCFCLVSSSAVIAAESVDKFYAQGWTLDPEQSFLKFQSIKEKNGPKPEFSEFAFFEGSLDEQGSLDLTVQLDSIDTKIDLRNVRMRFLLFETFKFPTAKVISKLDDRVVLDLLENKRIRTQIEFELQLYGNSNQLEVDVVMTLVGNNRVAVSTASPVKIGIESFGLLPGLEKLQDAAQVKIMPSTDVHFDFVFVNASSNSTALLASNAPTAAPASTVLETAGRFSREECIGRFEILSRTGAIYFQSGSAALSSDSVPMLSTLTDIVERCPDLSIVVEGHTDSHGPDHTNLALSIARADSVVSYLIGNGISSQRIQGVGFGETRPVVGNNSARNRSRNRRIEFKVAGG